MGFELVTRMEFAYLAPDFLDSRLKPEGITPVTGPPENLVSLD